MAIELEAQQALRIWRGALSDSVREIGPDLSARQMAILLTVFLEPPPHTVRGLARDLGIAKPVVTRALNSLVGLGFITKQRDHADGRNVLVQRTMKGARYLAAFADLIVKSGKAE